MDCPNCSHATKVTSTESEPDFVTYRIRYCPRCKLSFATEEKIYKVNLLVPVEQLPSCLTQLVTPS